MPLRQMLRSLPDYSYFVTILLVNVPGGSVATTLATQTFGTKSPLRGTFDLFLTAIGYGREVTSL